MADNAITDHGQTKDMASGDAVGQVNLRRPPDFDGPSIMTETGRGITIRDIGLGVIAILVIVVGLILILQAAYQITPS